ncbi:hypothetical protein [Flavobacterium aquatile]|uniref:hypothetical protein n=1 Tax=Flavobacterium aquatile TaxID=245 RepID=UPI000AFC8F12|nr:hypothetical protein [Flavobacterium aquatile]
MIKSLLKIDLEKDKTNLALIAMEIKMIFSIIFIVMESRNMETKNAQAFRSCKQF